MEKLLLAVLIVGAWAGPGCTRAPSQKSQALQSDSALASRTSTVPRFSARHAGDLLGGEVVIETIRNADTVEVFELKHREFAKRLSDYEVVQGPLPVAPSLANELKGVVTAYDSYEREWVVGCNPYYHARTTFVHGDSTVDVVYCFHCSMLQVFHNGAEVGGGLFQPAEGRFNSIAGRMLPDDEALQKLE